MTEGGLAVETKVEGDRIVATFSGSAELPAVAALGKLLHELHARAVASSVKEIHADLRHLEFMNSSCFKNLITWITELQDEPADKQYQIHFLSSSAMLWQRRSMHALKSFATELIHIETDA